ncbi:hypothetical protein [Mesonia aquimarina]|uniref:hypothetical protein n=1 Tax=Mesonia aquimarina TaxID=1504967 RepID=UPI000EF5C4D5|nr:hypothetical protein [Mesonia aquimarina]
MFKHIFFILLVGCYSPLANGQQTIGKIEGAEVFETKKHYELIFKNKAINKYTSAYLTKNGKKENAYTVLKRYVFSLFDNPTIKSYLLQLEDDSLYLVYKDKKVRIEIWRNHNSNNRKSSQWYSYAEYLQLFGITLDKNTF